MQKQLGQFLGWLRQQHMPGINQVSYLGLSPEEQMDSCTIIQDQSNGRSRSFRQENKYFYSASEVPELFFYIRVREMEV